MANFTVTHYVNTVMTKGSPIPEFVNSWIWSLSREGETSKRIEKKLAKMYKIAYPGQDPPSDRHIRRVVQNRALLGKSGGPPKQRKENPRMVFVGPLMKTLVRFIRINHREGRQLSLTQIHQELGLTCSIQTLRRAVKRIPGAVARKPLKALHLSEAQKTKRRKFVKIALRDLEPEFWKGVVFADEKKFSLSGPDSRPPVWTMGGRRAIHRRHPCTRIGVMVWMGFGPEGIIGPEWVRQTVKKETYIEILKKYRGDLSPVFMDDGAAAHRAKLVKKYCLKCRIQRVCDVVCDAPKLVEVNVIENLWSILQRRLFQSGTIFETPDALFLGIQEVVNRMKALEQDKELYETLTDAIPKRLKRIKAVRGDMLTKR